MDFSSKTSTIFKCIFLSEQIKDRCSMLLQWLVIVNRGRSASHTSTAVGNDSIHIVSKWGLEMRELEIRNFHGRKS